MFNWAFKKIVKFREKVAVDLGDKDVEKPFLDHLDDLRSMLVRMCVTLLVVTVCAFVFYQELLALIERPLVLAGIRDKISLQNLKPIGGFMTAMNVSLVAGVITSFPLLLYFLLQFVLPGLRSNEKKVVFPALAVGGGLFLSGVLFAFYVVSPRALEFFYQFSVEMDQVSAVGGGALPPDKLIWERVEYVKFVCQFVLIFGLCFELPVVVMALVKLDVLNYKVMKGSRAWAAIIICVVAAVITPTQDALTLGLLAVPMYVLYEICIWLAWWLEKKDRAQYPEYYKDQDTDAKEVEVSDDWDNENYNPWNEDGSDDEEANSSSTAAKSTPPATEPGTSVEPSTSAESTPPSDDATPAPVETPSAPAEAAPSTEASPPPADESTPPEDAGESPAPSDDEPDGERRNTD